MKIFRSRFFENYLPPTILAISLLVLYLRTLAPGLSWANAGSDGGDLIAAAVTGGVPHPTGYPLYLLLARLFQFLPLGSLAFRTNLMSAIAAVLAAVLIYEIVTSARFPASSQPRWPAGMAAAYAFGLAPLVWSQAVITEVYSLQSLLIALILYLYLRPAENSPLPQRSLDYLRGLALGLAMGNHVTAVFLVPVAFVLGSVQRQIPPNDNMDSQRSWFQSYKLERGALLRQLAMFGAGLSIYLIIPLRALMHPPINWGNAITPARFWWLVSGQIYRSYYLEFTLSGIWQRVQAIAALLLGQFGWIGILLGLVGLVVFGRRSPLYILTAWTAAFHAAFAAFYGSVDSYVYLIPMLLCFAIWIGLALIELSQQLPQRWSFLHLGFGLLMMAYFASRSATFVSQVNARNDLRAEAFGREIFTVAPENGIVFANGDDAVFTLWYFHFALGERPDLAVVASDLLHFDWYQENLRATYPGLVVPGPFPWPETLASSNPSRAACYVRYSEGAEINCSQPLTTP